MKTRRIFSILLALAMVFTMLPAVKKTAKAAEPTFTKVQVSDADTLQSYLEKSGNYIIDLANDISYMFNDGYPYGSIYASVKLKWCTIASGIKVLNLNGHSLIISQDHQTVKNDQDWGDENEFRLYSDLFVIPAGAEMVINDPGNKGKIEYRCFIKEHEGNQNTTRNIFRVTEGGKLTINGGRIIAGRKHDNAYYICSGVFGVNSEYYYRQTNGIAVINKGGDVTIHGGVIQGRGYVTFNNGSDMKDCWVTRAAAVWHESGSLKIYDGEFIGSGNAGVLRKLTPFSENDVEIYGGSFSTYKLDQPVEIHSGEYIQYGPGAWTGQDKDWTVNGFLKSNYGLTGIDSRILKDVGKYTRVYKSGVGYLTADQVGYGDGNLNTHKNVTITPMELVPGELYQYDPASDTYQSIEAGATVSWDKNSSLRFMLSHNYYFPRNLRSFDVVDTFDYGNTYAVLRTSPGGEDYSYPLNATPGIEWVDLNLLQPFQKSLLKVGQTYYLRMFDSEEWKTTDTTHDITYYDAKYIKIKIVEEESVPSLNLSMSFENSLTDSGKNQITLIPGGDGTSNNLDVLVRAGKITGYTATFTYYDQSGTKKTYSTNNAAGSVKLTDFYRGLSDVTYSVDLYKSGTKIGTYSTSQTVLCFPEISANKTIDSSNRILVEPDASDKTVTLSSNANSYSKIFWVKDGSKISGSANKQSWTVDLSSSGNSGWYSLGYTLSGTDYFGEEQIYLAIKDGTRTVNLSTSATSCSISSDSSTTPTLTAQTSGTGWGTISQYKWRNVSWPDGAKPNAWATTTTTNTITMAKLFCGTDSITKRIVAGTYVFSCTVRDSNGKEATSGTVSITVSRPVTGLQLWHDVGDDSYNVTGGFIILDKGKKDALRAVYTPENSVPSSSVSTSFSSSNTNTATATSAGTINAKNFGTATITAKYSSYSATTQVLVPKTRYNLPLEVQTSWLNVQLGETVHRGQVELSSNEDFTAELTWYVDEGSSSYEYTGDTFESNHAYYAEIKIYPNAGVCYPVEVEYDAERTWYNVEKDRIEIAVGDTVYYGATYCGRDYFYDDWQPVSEAQKNKDWIILKLDSSEKLMDWRDEYLDRVTFNLEIPQAGDPRNAIGNESKLLNCTMENEGIDYYMDSLKRVTDLSTIEDETWSNDALEDFTTFEEGKTYRAGIYLLRKSGYTNALGGKVLFAESVKAYEPELGCLSSDAYVQYGMVYAVVYFTVPVPEAPSWIWKRFAGSNRYATMAMASQEAYYTDGSCEYLIVASGQAFPDALAGSALAGVYDCPILLTNKAKLSAETKSEIQRLAAPNCLVMILGGKGAVSDDVVNAIGALGVRTERIAGSNREATAIAIYQRGKDEGFFGDSGSTVIITTGYSYADALSISPYACASTTPILLAKKDGSLSEETKDLLWDEGFRKVIIIGGKGAVNEEAENYIRHIGLEYIRLSGTTRYETSAEVLKWEMGLMEDAAISPEVEMRLDGMGVATGTNFADALGSVSLLGKSRSPLLLVADNSKKNIAQTQANIEELIAPNAKKNMNQGYIFGGTGAVSAQIEDWLNAVSE